MSLTTPGGRHLALGDRAEDAAAVFGPLFDEVRVASYDEAGAWVDDALLDSVGLVAGAGLGRALRAALDRAEDGLTILVGLPADLRGSGQVHAVAEELGLVLTTEHRSDDAILMGVRRSADGSWSCDAAAAVSGRPLERGRTGSATADEPDTRATPVDREPRTPTATGPGRRRLALVAAASGVVLVALVAMTVLLAVLVGAEAAALVLLVATLLTVGATGALALLAVRRMTQVAARLDLLLDADRAREEVQFRRRTDRRTRRLIDLQRESDLKRKSRFDRIDRSLASLAVTPARLDALSALVSRRLAAEQEDPDDPARG